MKNINYANVDHGQVFWDDDNNVICALHENDARVSREYFDKLFNFTGHKLVNHKYVPEAIKTHPINKWLENYMELG